MRVLPLVLSLRVPSSLATLALATLALATLALPTLALAQPGAPAEAVPAEAPPAKANALKVADEANTLKAHWTALLAGGCDLDAAHVRTTLEASALRNTPYALKGYAFKAAELTALFQADGGWYVPDPAVKAPAFSPAESGCIKKLKDLEASLDAKVAIAAPFKAKFLADHQLVLDLRAHTAQLGKGRITTERSGSGYILNAPEGEVRELQLHCEEKECHLLVPGI
jgi:hypothetical protein